MKDYWLQMMHTHGLMYGLLYGLMYGLVYGLMYGLMYGLLVGSCFGSTSCLCEIVDSIILTMMVKVYTNGELL